MPPSIHIPLNGHRLQLYGAFSTLLVSAVIASAFHKHSNFYSATVFLSRSSASVMVLANYGGFLTLLFGRVVQQVFFGRLTNQEVERLYDRTWFFLTESLLAFTIFRDEFDAPFVCMFGALLFLKCFHWLIADRIDWMDQQPYPGPPWLFHIRTNAMFFILWTIDLLMLDFAVESVLTHGVGGIVLFGSEYAILLASCFNSVLKYGVMVYDIRRASTRGGEDAPVWENKSMYMFYIELVTDFIKLTTYLTFFMIVMMFFGLPLNIIRDVYITAVSFYTRFRDLLRYRAATKDMETKYPDATEVELNAMSDRTCIICREEMTPASSQPRAQAQQQAQNAEPVQIAIGPNGLPLQNQSLALRDPPKKLPCGHVFHFQCLRSWLERQQSCPTCRRSVLETAEGAANPNAPANAANPAGAPGGPAPANGPAGVGGGARPGDAPAPQPGATPRAVPAPTPTAAGTATGSGVRAVGLQAPGSAPRARSPAPAQPRAFQGFSVGGVWQSWEVAGVVDEPTRTARAGTASVSGSGSGSGSGATSLLNGAVGASSSRSAGTSERGDSSNGTVTPIATPTTTATSSSSEGTSAAAQPVPPSTATAPAVSTPVPSESTSTPDTSQANDTPAEREISPRQAAAAAALRRLTGVASSLSSTPSPTNDAPKTPNADKPANGSSIPPRPPTPSASASTSASGPAEASSSSAAASSPPTKPSSVPTLIPLFDPSSVAHRPFLNISSLNLGLGFDIGVGGLNNMGLPTGPASASVAGTATPGGASVLSPSRNFSTASLSAFAQANASGSFPWGLNTGTQNNGSRTPAGAGSISSTPGWRTPAFTRSRAGSSAFAGGVGGPFEHISHPASGVESTVLTPVSEADSSSALRLDNAALTPLQVPGTLTDESQLRRLDAWTREAIDERLRVLEDVQRSLWKAAEELQRVRSIIPSSTISLTTTPFPNAPLPTPIAPPPSAVFGNNGADVKGKGKAKAVFSIPEREGTSASTSEEGEGSEGVLSAVGSETASDAVFSPIEVSDKPLPAE